MKPGSRLFGLTCWLEAIDAAAAAAEKAGAEIAHTSMNIPDHGKFAIEMRAASITVSGECDGGVSFAVFRSMVN